MNIFNFSGNYGDIDSEKVPPNFNREYIPFYRLSLSYVGDIEVYKEHLKKCKDLCAFPKFGEFISDSLRLDIVYSNICYRTNYKNSRFLKLVSALEYINNSYILRSSSFYKYSGALRTNEEILYMLFVKSTYVYDLDLRIFFELPIDYSNFMFCIHPKMLSTQYSGWFNPIIPDLIKMNEAGVNIVITDDIVSKIIPKDFKYIADLDERRDKELELGRMLSQKLRDKFYVTRPEPEEPVDLPF